MKTTSFKNETRRKKNGKSRFSRVVAWLHLWPSLISSVILIFVCLTGTIVVYCDEIIDFVNRDAMYVPEVKEERLPVEELIRRVKAGFS